MNECLITIVVPMYNNSKTIGRLLSSIAEQTSDQYKVIVVDDGSQDNSIEIAEKYINRIKDIFIIRLEHRGVSEARNEGIDRVKTPYLIFADADDELEKNAIQYIADKLVSCKSEWLFFDYSEVLYDGEKYKKNLRENEDMYYSFASDYRMNPIWNRVYCTSVIKENGIRFNGGYKKGEDFLFNMDYCKCVGNRFVSFENPLYRYRSDNAESVIHRFAISDFDEYIGLYKKTVGLLKEADKYENRYILAAKQRLLNEVIKYLYDLSMSSVKCFEKNSRIKSVYANSLVKECISDWHNDAIKCANRNECSLIYKNLFYLHYIYIISREFYKRLFKRDF